MCVCIIFIIYNIIIIIIIIINNVTTMGTKITYNDVNLGIEFLYMCIYCMYVLIMHMTKDIGT